MDNEKLLEKEIEKYKALYENEKSHTETLISIINRLLSYIPYKTEPGIDYMKDFGLKPPYKITCENEN